MEDDKEDKHHAWAFLDNEPQNKLDRFCLEYVQWRGLAPTDYRGAPWIEDPKKQVFTGPMWPVKVALKAAWGNTIHWKPKK